jgi:hypothetical protein
MPGSRRLRSESGDDGGRIWARAAPGVGTERGPISSRHLLSTRRLTRRAPAAGGPRRSAAARIQPGHRPAGAVIHRRRLGVARRCAAGSCTDLSRGHACRANCTPQLHLADRCGRFDWIARRSFRCLPGVAGLRCAARALVDLQASPTRDRSSPAIWRGGSRNYVRRGGQPGKPEPAPPGRRILRYSTVCEPAGRPGVSTGQAGRRLALPCPSEGSPCPHRICVISLYGDD